MKIRERQTRDEIEVVCEIVGGLARKARDQVGADRDVRHRARQTINAVAKVASVVAAAHPLERVVSACLQRQMEMGAEFRARRDYFDYPIAQLLGIERTQPDSPDRRALFDHLKQRFEGNRRIEVLAVAAQMDPGQDNLLEALIVQA